MAEDIWKMVKRDKDGQDTRTVLEQLGFTEVRDEFSYQPSYRIELYDAVPPAGWTKHEHGNTTDIFDDHQVLRAQMYYKNLGYPHEMRLDVMNVTVSNDSAE